MVASVKKGLYPCPRCLIPIRKFRDMGMLRDKRQRAKLGRRDDFQRRSTVAKARGAIYTGRYAVDGETVNKMLVEQSLAPIAVGADIALG
jgi:hypothetical protein